MSTEPASDGMSMSQLQEHQLTLDEFRSAEDRRNRCEAIAEYTGERCRHDALPGCAYCADHFHLTDVGD